MELEEKKKNTVCLVVQRMYVSRKILTCFTSIGWKSC